MWTSYFRIMSQYDRTFDLKIKCRSLWPIFHGPVILPYILKTIWCMNIIFWDYESVWQTFDLKINVGHCDLYFMVQWFLLYILKTIWYMNTILWDSESVWRDVWPQNICSTLWRIFCLISWNLFSGCLPQGQVRKIWGCHHEIIPLKVKFNGF